VKKLTTSILLWDAQHELLTYAANVEGKNVSEYVREVVIPFVAQRVGKPVPKVPALEPLRPAQRSGQHVIDVAELTRAIVAELTRKGQAVGGL
jgi:hypothetical protein